MDGAFCPRCGVEEGMAEEAVALRVDDLLDAYPELDTATAVSIVRGRTSIGPCDHDGDCEPPVCPGYALVS